ncbi:MAG: aspartate-semialdehyde dehydrogenase [Candidatus Marinimicrobia bacterium]|nr:aspartate-semialdehyde dehydrogenase [FCB group bacterium]MBL7024294.1 aspartate-semialdehyde dehydrogenase [Candidatus Neomarinimicrobiota bacterium]
MIKIAVGVLGATGVVGQNYVRLLTNHPWFEIKDLAASPRSAGKTYGEAVGERWLMETPMPEGLKNMPVRDVTDYGTIPGDIKLFFSATELEDKQATRDFEFAYASKGYPVVSNSSANRWTPDVPMIIPEINGDHLEILPIQQKNRNFPRTGFVAVKPNCSVQSYLVAIHALREAGYPVEEVLVNTLQALSGAGYKGLTEPERRITVNPLIPGEEEKTEKEPSKILGLFEDNQIIPDYSMDMSALCTRVPVVDGHTALVYLNFAEEIPALETIKKIWSEFTAEPQSLGLPSAPMPPILVMEEEDRPQVHLDVNNGDGMAVTIGRLAEDKFFDIRFVALSHNTIRGAAGGAILTAELLVEKGFV